MLLDTMRKHSRSFIIYIFFAIIIAVFVVNFGPQSAGCGGVGSSFVGKIGGKDVSINDIQYAFNVSGALRRATDDASLARWKSWAIDQFLVRELMAKKAASMGMSISDDEIRSILLKGFFYALGSKRAFTKKDEFDYKLFSRYIRYWGMTVKQFQAQQKQELLAKTYENIIRSSINISESDIEALYRHQGNRAQLQYVRFSPAEFRKNITLSANDIQNFIKTKHAAIKAHYEKNKTAYTKLPKQIELSAIKLDIAQKNNAQTLIKEIKTSSFSAVASKVSKAPSAKKGGYLGWRDAQKPGLGEEADKKISALKVGNAPQIVETKDALWIVKLAKERSGDLSIEQAQEDIARELLIEGKSKALANKQAEDYLKRAQAGEKLESLFPKKDEKEESKLANSSSLKLQTTSYFPRSADNLVFGIGASAELMKAAFSLEKGKVANKLFTVQSAIYLVALKDRKEADMQAFAKQKDRMLDNYRRFKEMEILSQYRYELCNDALKNNEMHFSELILSNANSGPPGSAPTQNNMSPKYKYSPCKTLKPSSPGQQFGQQFGQRRPF